MRIQGVQTDRLAVMRASGWDDGIGSGVNDRERSGRFRSVTSVYRQLANLFDQV